MKKKMQGLGLIITALFRSYKPYQEKENHFEKKNCLQIRKVVLKNSLVLQINQNQYSFYIYRLADPLG